MQIFCNYPIFFAKNCKLSNLSTSRFGVFQYVRDILQLTVLLDHPVLPIPNIGFKKSCWSQLSESRSHQVYYHRINYIPPFVISLELWYMSLTLTFFLLFDFVLQFKSHGYRRHWISWLMRIVSPLPWTKKNYWGDLNKNFLVMQCIFFGGV